MADLTALETWAADLLHKLQPTQRRRLLTEMARQLRAANTQRIRAQTDPEGAAWEPRKPPGPGLRSRRERLRQQARQGQPMFQKLRQARQLKARAEGASAAVVEFAGRAQRVAKVHHFGQVDHVNPGGPLYHYPARELLGIAPQDLAALRSTLLNHLNL